MNLFELSKLSNSLKRAEQITGLSFASIRKMLRLSEIVDPEIKFLNQQELKIFQELCDKNESGDPMIVNGTVRITDASKRQNAEELLAKLRLTEIELKYEPFEISESELKENLPINAEDVKLLSPFIRFGKGEEPHAL